MERASQPVKEERKKVSVMTWNIWFVRRQIQKRMEALLTWVEAYRPDIIAFQEVTLDLLHHLDAPESFLSAEYRRWSAGRELEQGYWETIYARKDLDGMVLRHSYSETYMGRGCTLFHCPSFDLVVGATHLESLDSADIRELQAADAARWLEAFPAANCLFMGDMNLHNGQSLVHILKSPWQDAWAVLRPTEDGFSWNPEKNPHLEGGDPSRLDRIFARLQDYTLSKIEMLGDIFPGPRAPTTCPSDHFGLYLELVKSPRSPDATQ